jgi:hypothetical protein
MDEAKVEALVDALMILIRSIVKDEQARPDWAGQDTEAGADLAANKFREKVREVLNVRD